MSSDECKTGRLDKSVRVLLGMDGGPGWLFYQTNRVVSLDPDVLGSTRRSTGGGQRSLRLPRSSTVPLNGRMIRHNSSYTTHNVTFLM